MTSSKGWTIVIVAVCGILIVGVHVIFKVTISVIVFQRVYESVGRVLIPKRPWRETYIIVKNCRTAPYLSNNNNNDLTLHKESPMYTSSTQTLKLQFDDHEVSETTLAHELTCVVQSTWLNYSLMTITNSSCCLLFVARCLLWIQIKGKIAYSKRINSNRNFHLCKKVQKNRNIRNI